MARLEKSETAFQASYLVKAKGDLPYEAYRRHQLEVHVPLALNLPGLVGYRLTLFPPVDGVAQAFQGLAQVTFESRAAHDAALAAPEGQAALADLPNYLEAEEIVFLAAGPEDQFEGVDLSGDPAATPAA